MDPAARSAIHALTASGAVLGLLAILSVMRSDARTSLLWLALALAVDALDGPLARKLRVRNVIPNVDGEVLDLVVDYSNYVLAPALFFTPSACCRKAGSSRVPASSC